LHRPELRIVESPCKRVAQGFSILHYLSKWIVDIVLTLCSGDQQGNKATNKYPMTHLVKITLAAYKKLAVEQEMTFL
jgi:hypothetical protein